MVNNVDFILETNELKSTKTLGYKYTAIEQPATPQIQKQLSQNATLVSFI